MGVYHEKKSMTTLTSNEDVGLVDTNVLVYRADTDSKFHSASIDLIQRGHAGEISLCLAPQNLTEFFAILTSPRRVANPLTPIEAWREIEKYHRSMTIRKIHQNKRLIPTLSSLISKYPVKGQEIFDLQLVATMLINDVTRIYTFNDKHFAKYSEIKVVIPTANKN